MIWDETVRIEPRLGEPEKEIQGIEDDGKAESFCANAIWFGDYKPEITHLVGWFAKNPELRSSQAYDLANRMLYRSLPAFRNCSCL
jgi:hypothetical protein